MWEMHNGFGWWMVLGSAWFVVFWGLIIWGVVSLTSSRKVVGPEAPGALDIVKGRYARGEISREEFEQLRKDLA